MTRPICHACRVREGQLHEPGCDMEVCPGAVDKPSHVDAPTIS
jgi:hypothetical protein